MRKYDYLVISDLHGWKDIDLGLNKKVLRLDSREIGGIKSTEDAHQQFLEFGIDKGATVLKAYQVDTVIGLSVGGVIAWRSLLKGWKVNKLIAISSTRLRFEKEKPSVNTFLLYGQNDTFKPDRTWFEKMNIEHRIVASENHDLYKRTNFRIL